MMTHQEINNGPASTLVMNGLQAIVTHYGTLDVLAKVNLAKLDQGSGADCIIAQLTGQRFTSGVNVFAPDNWELLFPFWASERGFDVPMSNDDYLARMRELTAEWREVVRDIQALLNSRKHAAEVVSTGMTSLVVHLGHVAEIPRRIDLDTLNAHSVFYCPLAQVSGQRDYATGRRAVMLSNGYSAAATHDPCVFHEWAVANGFNLPDLPNQRDWRILTTMWREAITAVATLCPQSSV